MKSLRVNTGNPTKDIFLVNKGHNVFNQLAVKVDMDGTEDREYFKWLDKIIGNTEKVIPGVSFLEKENVRENPPLNTAVYYDTADYKLLPTGALLRTSCNIITHAFCAFKMPEDEYGNRLDRRHVFNGEEKIIIQQKPYSSAAVETVKNLLGRNDIDHPGVFLKREFGITPEELKPAIVLFGNRSTFYVLLDGHDALRCSIDRSKVFNFRSESTNEKSFREVEISIYPRILKKISHDSRLIPLIKHLSESLVQHFDTEIIYQIKYQRAARKLDIPFSVK